MQRLFILFSIILISCGQSNNSVEKTKIDTVHKETTIVKLERKLVIDTITKVIWREDLYDPILKDTESTIVLNDNYFKNISEPEKAAVGYVATFIGSECNWDGEANDSFTNLSCKVIKALGLGYQCSDTHLNFLRHWFRDNPKVLNELKDCPTKPFTATQQNTFDNLSIAKKNDTIKIHYDASGVNMREEKNWNWSEDVLFKISTDKLVLISRKKKNGS